jgi:hypothetical protein
MRERERERERKREREKERECIRNNTPYLYDREADGKNRSRRSGAICASFLLCGTPGDQRVARAIAEKRKVRA